MENQANTIQVEVAPAEQAKSLDRAFWLEFVMRNYILILLGLNIVLALFLRFYDLTGNPNGLDQDEVVNGVDAFSIGQTLRDHHGNFLPTMLQSFEDWASPALTYLTVPFVWLLGLTEWSVRLPIALSGVASVGLMFFYVKGLTRRSDLAILASFFLNIMPWHIFTSRWAIPPDFVTFSLLLFLYIYQRLSEATPKLWKYGLIGLAAAFLIYTYPTQKMFGPMLLAIFVLVDLLKRLPFKQVVIKFGVIGGTALALTAPVYLLALLEPDKYNARFVSLSIFSLGNPVGEFLTRYVGYFDPGFLFKGYNNYAFLSPFYFVGVLGCVYALFAGKLFMLTRPVAVLLLGWWMAFPVAAALTTDFQHFTRTIHGFPLVIIFIALGVGITVDWLKSRVKNAGRYVPLVYLSVFLVSVYFLSLFLPIYFEQNKEVSKFGFQYGVKEFSLYLNQNVAKFDNVVVDDRINQPYVYYLFYSKEDPHRYNYAEINARKSGLDGLWGIPKLDKYTYAKIDPEIVKGATLLYAVNDENNVNWYNVYARDRQWFVVKEYSPAG